jgi:hypothetical protein
MGCGVFCCAKFGGQDYFILSEMEQQEARKGGDAEVGWQTAQRIASLHQARSTARQLPCCFWRLRHRQENHPQCCACQPSACHGPVPMAASC